MTDQSGYPKVTEARIILDGIPYYVRIDSSNITDALYDSFAKDLIITFTNNSRYRYKKFPHNSWVDFLKSESKGVFLNSEIKGKFEYEKLES